MTNQELREEIVKNLVIEAVPKKESGGQSVGRISPAIKLYSEELDLEIKIGAYRSQYQNRDAAMTIFQIILDDYLK
jgi:protein subunit release factor A